jgi:uncharacterized tellurite resistance protein B-like protein
MERTLQMIDELAKREEIIKKYVGWFDEHTCKNWDTEIMLKEFADEIIPLNADGNSRQVEQIKSKKILSNKFRLSVKKEFLKRQIENLSEDFAGKFGVDSFDLDWLFEKIEKKLRNKKMKTDYEKLTENK